MPLLFRDMLNRDADAIAKLEVLCFTLPWSKKLILEDIRNPLTHNRVAELDGGIVAYCGMWLIIDEAHITNIAVHPEHRGRGYGEAMLRNMMRLALSKDANSVSLEVRKSNAAAIKLYRKLGFTLAGIRPEYYHDNMEDALIMWNRDIAAAMALPARD